MEYNTISQTRSAANPLRKPRNLSRPDSSCADFEPTLQHKFYEYLANSTGAYLPPQYDRYIQQEERKHVSVSDIRIKCPEVNFTQLQNQLEEDFLAKSGRHEIRQALAEYIALNAGNSYFKYDGIITKLESARTAGVVGVTPDGRTISIWDDKVNCVRLCPDEAREECQRITRKYGPEIMRLLDLLPRARLYYAVYTEPNVPAGGLAAGKRSQFKRFANFHRSAWAKSCLKGSFVIQEDPLSKHLDWNIHLNAIHIVQGDFNYKTLRQHWGNNVEIREIKGTPEDLAKAFLECVKYAAKHIGEKSEDGKHTVAPPLTQWPFELFDEWFEAGKAFRRSRSYGQLYRPVAAAEKGVAIDTVSWIGQINWETNGYRVNLKKSVQDAFGVDLIQSDKFAGLSLRSSDYLKEGNQFGPPDNFLT